MEDLNSSQQTKYGINFNYENTFWQGYSILQSNYLKTKKNYSKLYYVFLKLVDLYDNHSKGLFNICKYFSPPNEMDANTTFNKAFMVFIDHLKDEADNYKKLSIETKEILEKNILVSIENIEKLFDANESELADEKNNSFSSSKVALRQHQFRELENSCKEAFELCEKMKREFHNQVNNSMIEHIRKQDFVKEDFKYGNDFSILEKKQKYKDVLAKANKHIENYIQTFQKHANLYQNIDHSFIVTLMESIQKYSSKRKSHLELSLNILNSKVNDSISTIKIIDDLSLIVEHYHTFGFPPEPLEFVNFSPDQSQFSEEINLTKDNPQTKKAFQFLIDYAQSYNEITVTKEQDIQDYFEKIIEGNMTREECDTLLGYFDDSAIGQTKQVYFLTLLNNIRTKQCQMKEISFYFLLEILCKIMEITDSPKLDSQSKSRYWNWCTILSQTFYTNNEHGEKIFLSEEMLKKNVFNRINWFELLQYVLLRNLRTTHNYIEYKFELTEQDKVIWKGIILSKIASILQNMIMLKLPDESLDNLIETVSCFFREDKSVFISLKEEFTKDFEADKKTTP